MCGQEDCIHRHHLWLQEMYVTGVLPFALGKVMYVALLGVSVTFSVC